MSRPCGAQCKCKNKNPFRKIDNSIVGRYELLINFVVTTVKQNEMEGKVKWFDAKKGYGFLLGNDGTEIYVHYSGLAMEGFKVLKYGKPVTYDTEMTDKGLQAVNVRTVKK